MNATTEDLRVLVWVYEQERFGFVLESVAGDERQIGLVLAVIFAEREAEIRRELSHRGHAPQKKQGTPCH